MVDLCSGVNAGLHSHPELLQTRKRACSNPTLFPLLIDLYQNAHNLINQECLFCFSLISRILQNLPPVNIRFENG